MRKDIKNKIINALKGAGIGGLSISEVAHRAKINRITATTYLRKMVDAGEVISIPKPPLNLHILKKSHTQIKLEELGNERTPDFGALPSLFMITEPSLNLPAKFEVEVGGLNE